MELSSFSENIVTETFERSGETVALKINLDALVPGYEDVLTERLDPVLKRLGELTQQHANLQAEIEVLNRKEEKRAKSKRPTKPLDFAPYLSRLKEITKGIDDIKREIWAERLTCPVTLPDGSTTCLLKGWDITENGMDIAASKENLLRMPSTAVEALFEFVLSRLDTVKKKADVEIEETSENTHNGSREPEALALVS